MDAERVDAELVRVRQRRRRLPLELVGGDADEQAALGRRRGRSQQNEGPEEDGQACADADDPRDDPFEITLMFTAVPTVSP